LQTGWVVGEPHPVCKFVNQMRVPSGLQNCKLDEVLPLSIQFTNLLTFC